MTLSIKNGRKVAKSKSFLISFLVMFRLRLWLKKKMRKKKRFIAISIVSWSGILVKK